MTPVDGLFAYRFFDKELDRGHIVLPRGEHVQNLSATKRAAEFAIRAGDERGAHRANAIFVYEDRAVAEALLHKTPGEHLYEVVVNRRDIISRSDLKIYDEIARALASGEPAGDLVREFWSGAERNNPRIELTIARAVISRKLIDAAEKPG
jgi:hypothetical protein